MSYADKEAEKLLVQGLRQILPEAGFITEEQTTTDRSDTLNWTTTLFDGTTNFIHGLPILCISVGFAHKEYVLAGVIQELNLNECFYAWKDGGAYCNGQPIKVSKTIRLEESLIATGFPYADSGKMDIYLAILRELLLRSHGLRRLGSAAIDLAYVACGRFEAFYEYNLNSWDMSAGVLLVQEAGGMVTDFKGGNTYLFGGQIIASAAEPIQQGILEVINRHWQPMK